MRDFLIFVALLAAAFFVVGETLGWQLGVAGQTPVYVYKKDGQAVAERRTIRRDELPVSISGRVRDGAVTVTVVYQDPGSFQTNRGADDPETVFEERFLAGQTIAIERLASEGSGIYQVQLRFDGATGLFRMPMPNASEL